MNDEIKMQGVPPNHAFKIQPNGCDGPTYYGQSDSFGSVVCKRLDDEPQGKPSWSEAPSWAEWLAQDEDGDWYWYAKKPGHELDYMGGFFNEPDGDCDIAYEGKRNPHWRDTLERRPAQQGHGTTSGCAECKSRAIEDALEVTAEKSVGHLHVEIDARVMRDAVNKAINDIRESGELPDLHIPADICNELTVDEEMPIVKEARFLGYRVEWSDEHGLRGWKGESE